MSGFSAAWLALREPADARARNAGLAEALAARLATHHKVRVVDLGAGTGANLRAVAPLLGPDQSWTLVENDRRLVLAAYKELACWAERNDTVGSLARFYKDGRQISVSFMHSDMWTSLESVAPEPVDLVTASALFDLASPEFIARVARYCAERRAIFYSVLTYNGIQHWTPRHPSDNAVTSAFNGHQMRDKGLGVAAGPAAPAHLADAFRIAGYSVQEGDSPWRLGAGDAALIAELRSGNAAAVAETRRLDKRTLEIWAARPVTAAEIGHTDTLAVPE